MALSPSPSPSVSASPASSIRPKAPLALAPIREFARRIMLHAIDEVKHSPPPSTTSTPTPLVSSGKLETNVQTSLALVLDRSLVGTIEMIGEMAIWRNAGIESVHWLNEETIQTSCNTLMYVAKPNKKCIHMLEKHMKRNTGNGKRKILYFMPKKSIVAERKLAEWCEVRELPIDMIMVDEDVVSTEQETMFKEVFVEGDNAGLMATARALHTMQCMYGEAPIVRGKGHAAHTVFKLLEKIKQEREENQQNAYPFTAPEISEIVIIDRTVDMMTPMLTPITYEALLDRVFGFHYGYVSIDPAILGKIDEAYRPPDRSGDTLREKATANEGKKNVAKKRKLLLNSSDSLFVELRDLSFRSIGSLLHKRADAIAATYNERHAAKTVSDMHSFMQKFKSAHAEHSLLQTHIALAESIKEYTRSIEFEKRLEVELEIMRDRTSQAEIMIEKLICLDRKLLPALQLMVLLTQTDNMKQRKYEMFKREILHSFGFGSFFTLVNLEKAGLLGFGRRGNWSIVRRNLRLLHEHTSSSEENQDVAAVYGDIVPLSVRLIEWSDRPGFSLINSVLMQLPGKNFEYRQDPQQGTGLVPHNLLSNKTTTNSSSITAVLASAMSPLADQLNLNVVVAPPDPVQNVPAQRKAVVLVWFIGGVMSSEISALRRLSQSNKHDRQYVIGTSKLTNGLSLLDSVTDYIPSGLDLKSLN